ncbi:hypothetical protein [Legionella hackeliae]|nr:hypothetical protein [Legionella hackeliae]
MQKIIFVLIASSFEMKEKFIGVLQGFTLADIMDNHSVLNQCYA